MRIIQITICTAFAFLSIAITTNNNGSTVKKDANAERFAKDIKASDLKKHLEIIASDAYEGRETGEKGQRMAAEYLKKQFAAMGIPPIEGLSQGYFQDFPIDIRAHNLSKVKIKDQEFEFMKDFYYYGRNVSDTTLKFDQITFLGYGIEEEGYSDYKNQDVKGKTIMILKGQPKELQDKYGDKSQWLTNRSKLILAKR
ncbi:MAG: hypothetical protein MRY83_02745, partial [Flavobacteriales bacterium]|nr:hypothetical protein [Flavobacteriales bacterium]